MNRIQFNRYITNADFNILFNELGWDNIPAFQYDTTIPIEEINYEMKAVTRKSGFIVYTCKVDTIPQNATCRKIDMRLRKYSNDYILIFVQRNSEHHLWIAPIKTVEKRDLVTIEYTTTAQADFLFSKLDSISFDIDEDVTIIDVTARIHGAFEVNSGKITKDFYAGFKKQHNSFVSFVKGIDTEGDKQWYASVMLNRLMFCYFIQKKGFLNFDVDYLRHKLEWSQIQRGENKFFQSFYKGFLCALFHGGLNSPEHNSDFEKIYGSIPYLNGGMFDEHQLEKEYADIDVDDRAFENLFAFFDKWRWHLDTRITATGKDINPDVLGYIFEQYINDRAQMGAYYTKGDITEYIGKNCIIPFLVDEVTRTSSARDFKPEGFVWQMLRESRDKYIYDAIKKGLKFPLPDYIEQGLDTSSPNLLERRARWNEKADEQLALPTEIWRETIDRRSRYNDIIKKIDVGEITQINDFITYNLDIRSFVYDLLATTTDHLFVRHFYAALQKITILDPTCGSGAFLFAALNILEPLYEICIDRMGEFHEQNDKLFTDELGEIENKYRSNIQHFIYKSIILRNLYGVDIMVEATEIAKLRLFLKMVAVVDVDKHADNLGLDPLPDIDFNIRCGNTLVGYATEEELDKDLTWGDMFANQEFKEKVGIEMQKVAMAYERFKDIQLYQQDDIVVFKQAKTVLRERLAILNDVLSHRLYGASNVFTYKDWLSSHQPFHWLAEFYQIIQSNGGFDVIIGNPPYVEYTEKKMGYIIEDKSYRTYKSRNLYSFVFERSKLLLVQNDAKIGLIVQISSISTPSMETMCQEIKTDISHCWISNYATRPSYLFDGVCMNLTIILGNIKVGTNEKKFYTTNYIRWNPDSRCYLFNNLRFVNFNTEDLYFNYAMPKLTSKLEHSLIKKLKDEQHPIQEYLSINKQKTEEELFYRTAGGRYFKVFSDREFGSESKSNKSKCFKNDFNVYVFIALLSSNYWWWYYTLHFDMYNCKDYMMYNFNFDYLKSKLVNDLSKLGRELSDDIFCNAIVKEQQYATTGVRNQLIFKPAVSKSIIDKIDLLLAHHYGFTAEELDFIINYDIKYRMGSELLDSEE